MSDPDAAQRATLGLLLDRHPAMIDVEDLRDQLVDVDVDFALRQLIEDGLVSRLGDRVSCTRAAVRGNQLAP